MEEIKFEPEIVSITDGRITLPRAYCQAILWATGNEAMRVWLLELSSGRFRLLSDQEVEQNQKLSEIRRALIESPGEIKSPPTEFESRDVAFLVARLIPARLSPQGPT